MTILPSFQASKFESKKPNHQVQSLSKDLVVASLVCYK